MKLCVCDFVYDRFSFFIFRLRITLRFLFLIYLLYFLRCGKRWIFEGVFFLVFRCINIFLYYILQNILYRISLLEFLNIIFFNLLVDFKLVLFDMNKRRIRKRCYTILGFEDLLSDHSDLYVQSKSIKGFLLELRLHLKKLRDRKLFQKLGKFRQERMEQKRAKQQSIEDKKMNKMPTGDTDTSLQLLQQVLLYPVSVTFEYKRVKAFVFLLKGSKLQASSSFYLRISRECILSFFSSSLSVYVVLEILSLAVSHQYDLKF